MGFFDLLFAGRCKICKGKSAKGSVCPECDSKLKSLVYVRKCSFRVSGSEICGSFLFDYNNDIVKKLLFALKRNADKDLFRYAARLYELAMPSDFKGTVTFVPRRRVSVREYGYDHVLEPCKILCKSKGNATFDRLVKRCGFSKDQKNMKNAADRVRNVADKFAATKNDIPENIVLLDDVVTTGSTAKACAEALLKVKADADISFAFLASQSRFTGIG